MNKNGKVSSKLNLRLPNQEELRNSKYSSFTKYSDKEASELTENSRDTPHSERVKHKHQPSKRKKTAATRVSSARGASGSCKKSLAKIKSLLEQCNKNFNNNLVRMQEIDCKLKKFGINFS